MYLLDAIIAVKAVNMRTKCGKVPFHWEVRGSTSEKMTCKRDLEEEKDEADMRGAGVCGWSLRW